MPRLNALIAVVLLNATAAHAAAPIYRCVREGATTFSDHPCDAAATPYEIDSSRVSTYSPLPAAPVTSVPPRKRHPAADDSGSKQRAERRPDRRMGDCERVQREFREIRTKMRTGYTAKQGERLREREAALKQRRRDLKCQA